MPSALCTPPPHVTLPHLLPRKPQALLKEKTQNTIQVFEKLKETKASLKDEQAKRAMAEEALAAQRQEVARAQAAAAAAAESARSAQTQAAAAVKAADGARADAAAARQQLAAVQSQLQRLQALCDSMQAQVAATGSAAAAAPPPPQLAGPEAAALQGQLETLQAEQAAMRQQLQRWQAALTPFAMAAAGLVGGGVDASAAAAAATMAPVAAAALAAPAAAPAIAPAAAPAAAPAPGRRRGGGAAGAGAAGGTAAPTSPRQPRGKAARQKEQQQREAGEAEAQRRVALLAASAPEKPEDVRARAVAARQAAAAAATAGVGAKRPRTGGDGFGSAPAQADVLAGALALPSKRARQAAPAAGGAGGGVASPRSRPNPPQQQQQQRRGAAVVAPTAAAAAPAAEASLAISANELAMEQQREQLTAADEAAQLLGRITAGSGSSISQKVVHEVAAQLQLMHDDCRLPLPLLLACFETAVLECAAPKPQAHHLVAAAAQDAQPAALPAAHAAPGGWFEQQQQQPLLPGSAADLGGSVPFAAVWCSREALTSHRLHWLLHCATHLQRLQVQYAAAQAAARGQPAPQLTGFADALQQHLHRLVVRCCLAGSMRSSAAGRKSSSSALRHTETELCALAAAAAGLCRAAGDADVSLGCRLVWVGVGARAPFEWSSGILASAPRGCVLSSAVHACPCNAFVTHLNTAVLPPTHAGLLGSAAGSTGLLSPRSRPAASAGGCGGCLARLVGSFAASRSRRQQQ